MNLQKCYLTTKLPRDWVDKRFEELCPWYRDVMLKYIAHILKLHEQYLKHKSWHVIYTFVYRRPRASWSGRTNQIADSCDIKGTDEPRSILWKLSCCACCTQRRLKADCAVCTRPSWHGPSVSAPMQNLHFADRDPDALSHTSTPVCSPPDWEDGAFFTEKRGQIRRGSRCKSEYERGWGWEVVGRGQPRRSGRAGPEWTAPDRLVSTPGTQRTTAGDWPTACQSALARPPCPIWGCRNKRPRSLFLVSAHLL